jgi:muramoyltetrapeptide carboxypeptidase
MPLPLKPPALRPADAVRILSLSSPVEAERLEKGAEELTRLGYAPMIDRETALARDGFFAGSTDKRINAFKAAIAESDSRAIFCTRGGYGANYLLDGLSVALASPKLFCGFSDITSLHIFLWQKFGWVTIHGPMVAAGLDRGAGAAEGYDRESFLHAVSESKQGWALDLKGETLVPGVAEGVLLGGCLNLVEATLGTPWELDTRGALLILEDRAMKPWHVDKALMHLKQAGKFRGAAGVILGEFPESNPPAGTATVKEVAQRILGPLGVPIAWGVPVGHTPRPMLTLPLGVRARLSTDVYTKLEILEPACSA